MYRLIMSLVSLVIQGYGTSEIQFGQALKKHDRSSYILQTKGGAREDTQVFRKNLEMSFKKLQVRRMRIVSGGIQQSHVRDEGIYSMYASYVTYVVVLLYIDATIRWNIWTFSPFTGLTRWSSWTGR